MADPIRNALLTAQAMKPTEAPASKPWEQWPKTNYKSWDDVPVINPKDLVGKKIGSLLADLTQAGGSFSGIDSSRLDQPQGMFGGPGYPLLPESQKHQLGWAVKGKGKGIAKLSKDSDYIAIHAMNQNSHRSNTSVSNSILENLKAYIRDGRIDPKHIDEINQLIRKTSEDKKLKALETFPGFNSPDLEKYLHSLNFETRNALGKKISSAAVENLGGPNVSKILRHTLDPYFSGVPYGHAVALLEVPKGAQGSLVRLGKSGLPIHPSYDWGIHGRLVGRFAHPVAPEILHRDWFDKLHETNKGKITPTGKPPNPRSSFELALPTSHITQDVADKLPHHPADIQSGKAAQLALNAFNDQWHDTDANVDKGGLGPARLSRALRESDSASTLSQYSEKELNAMKKAGKFTGYKLKNGEVYFGLKRGTNYADEYGFHHPELTPNETALVSVVNNEPGAKGIGGAPVVLKAIQHGATALDAYAVPSDKHPNGFLPDFYSHFGFKELGRVPFDPKYVTHDENGKETATGKLKLADMKHEWSKAGWDESRHAMPSLAIMKWKGSDADRQDAVRRYVAQSSARAVPGSHPINVGSAAGPAEHGAGPSAGAPQGQRGLGDGHGNHRPVGTNHAPRSADRFTRTLGAVAKLNPTDVQHFGLNHEDIAPVKKAFGYSGGGKTFSNSNKAIRNAMLTLKGMK